MNPDCGMVCDNTVTLAERYDFFLVPQKTTQGTASPTSYNIIADTTGISPNAQQRLAFCMSHLYYNWAVSKIILFCVLSSKYNLHWCFATFKTGYAESASSTSVCSQVSLLGWRDRHEWAERTSLFPFILLVTLAQLSTQQFIYGILNWLISNSRINDQLYDSNFFTLKCSFALFFKLTVFFCQRCCSFIWQNTTWNSIMKMS